MQCDGERAARRFLECTRMPSRQDVDAFGAELYGV